MIYIKDKMNYVNNDTGFLTANEFNSMKNELANIVKYRNVLADNDDSQLLKAIVAESKTLFYTDNGVVNAIELKRNNEIDFSLDDDQVFIFSPSNTNTDVTTVKIGNNTAKRLLLNNAELPVGFLNSNITYMATYKKAIDAFEIKNLTIGNTSDFIFSNLHNEATFLEVNDLELGIGLYNNAIVYIDQNTGKYELAIIENPRTQKQNAIAIYKEINSKKYVFIDGIVPDFTNTLVSGFKYYLSDSDAGNISTNVSDVMVGRYIKDGRFLLNISGDVGLDANVLNPKIFSNNILNGQTSNGVIFTDVSDTYTLMYDTVTFNAGLPKKTMYAEIGTDVFKIEYANEYNGRPFNITKNNVRYSGVFKEATLVTNPVELFLLGETIVDTTKPLLSSVSKTFNTTINNPIVLETVTATDNIDGNLAVVKTGTVNFAADGTYNVVYTATDSRGNSSTITHTYIVTAIITYNTNITNPDSVAGVTITEPTDTLTFMFNSLTYDQTTPALVMFIKVDGVIGKIDYATEYTGRTFEVEKSGVRYIGTFVENESYVNPTTINVK